MSAGEEEYGYEAIIKALTDIKGSPTDFLKPPTFDWNSLEQFEDFQLFIKGMESWYTLQGIPDKAGDTTWLEYLLNFLGPIRWRKHEQWNPSGAMAEEWEKNRKSFYIAPWNTLCPNDAGYTSWKRSGSKLAKHQMNLLNESED